MITPRPFASLLSAAGLLAFGLLSPRQAGAAPLPNGDGGVVLSCGPDHYTYCYGNFWDSTVTYQGTTTFPISILFNSGNLESCCDNMTVYDGLNTSAPVIFSGNNGGDLTGLFFASTNPDHALTVQWESDLSVNCADGIWGFNSLDWTVGCLDCTAPTANFGVNLDCANNLFYATVDVTAMGTDPVIDVTNNGGAPPIQISAPGSYQVGPFALGAQVTVTLVNDQNSLCNVHSPVLTNPPCPIISCGPDTYNYCYTNSDQSVFVYQSANSQPLGILFQSGFMDTFGDQISIFNGLNQFSPLIYSGDGNFGDLSGLLFTSSNPDNALTIQLNMNTFESCSDFSFPDGWTYVVSCWDGCTAPEATFDVSLDCANNQFYITSDITSLGSAPSLSITNTGGAPPVQATAPGTYQSGPFPNGTSAQVTLESTNLLCNVTSAALTNGPCPVISCGPDNYTYCYGNFWDSVTVYQSANSYPIALLFNSGNMESCCDHITVHDGLNINAPVIYTGNGNFGDMTNLFFTSTNADNALTIEWHSDVSINCSDGTWGFAPLDWTVSCLDCTNPGASFTMVPDCIHNGFMIAVDVDSTGSSPTVDLVDSWSHDTIPNVHAGVTLVGPIPVDSVAHVTVLNSQNPLCKVVSQDFTYASDSCIITACTPTGVHYCYANHDTAWFIYQSGSSFPITLNIAWGSLLVNDYLQVFNGPTDGSQLIYMGNNGGNMAGLAWTSSNPYNALTFKIISSQVGSCLTGETSDAYWSVGCGAVGLEEHGSQELSLYPNPTTGDLYINLPSNVTGPLEMDVVDITGRLVHSEQVNASNPLQHMDLSSLQAGNYAVILRTEHWSQTRMVQLTH